MIENKTTQSETLTSEENKYIYVFLQEQIDKDKINVNNNSNNRDFRKKSGNFLSAQTITLWKGGIPRKRQTIWSYYWYTDMVPSRFEKITFGISVKVTQLSHKTHVQRSVGDFSDSFNSGPSWTAIIEARTMGRRIRGFHDGYETYFLILVHDKHNMNIKWSLHLH